MSTAFKIAATFLILSILWITLSDYAVLMLPFDIRILQIINIFKGYFFVTITSILLYLLINSGSKKLLQKQKMLADAQELAKVGGWEYNITRKKFKLSPELQSALNVVAPNEYSEVSSIWEYIHPEDIERVKTALEETIAKGIDLRINHRIVKPDGQIRHISEIGKLETDPNGESYIYGTAQDITETIQLQNTLELTSEENRIFGDMLDKVESLIIMTDINAVTTWVNSAFERVSGYNLRDVKGKHIASYLIDKQISENNLNKLNNCIRQKKYCNIELLNHKKNGDAYWVEMNFNPMFDKNDKHIGYIAIEADITERKNAEEKISAQNSLLREVTWLTSHEIRRPISSLLALHELLKDSNSLIEKEEYFDMIDLCIRDIDNIVKKINTNINKIDNNLTNIDDQFKKNIH
ncbi:PAS domain S-box protein [Pedobacter sp. HMF7647]|uniref:histidine kinase n=1 Tax=Hufsiella arboris TaxID=2695275 RepID=A0A7K1YC30_9SPHI|nr:PAS domain S-box protein [Hufsiella arboris]MXV52144.1 PAS domain S-box protein [Hufsiella arboris]